MTQFQINLEEEVLKRAVAVQLLKGELGEKVAEKLAEFQAEIMTFTHTEAAGLLNKSRTTVYQLESEGKLKFVNKTISLKALRDFRRAEEESAIEPQNEITRLPNQKKKRSFR